ncbi:interferon alpha-inducible protein 27-like protein 2A isoform X2 [Scyliorhinus canicula]|uniref:interferon alpha-inducible protein 27-like protein 2A isoform X2 n=1 Tax=Scyliorhinus canicula TaxID=7830 RepID=UPI0018F445BA|nr:interferon alpha-inducible protein 27-like protein 2A isoform X2 [Scyliorhinus canicula]
MSFTCSGSSKPYMRVTESYHNLNWKLIFGLWRKLEMNQLTLLILTCLFSAAYASPNSKIALMSLGAALTIYAANSFIAALGFTATGIAAGSWAATLMSISARLNGGEVPPGHFVTILQSIGTGGFAFSTTVMLGVIGLLLAIIIGIKLNIF